MNPRVASPTLAGPLRSMVMTIINHFCSPWIAINTKPSIIPYVSPVSKKVFPCERVFPCFTYCFTVCLTALSWCFCPAFRSFSGQKSQLSVVLVVKNGQKMVKNDQTWSKMVRNDQKWSSRWLKMVTTCHCAVARPGHLLQLASQRLCPRLGVGAGAPNGDENQRRAWDAVADGSW